MSNYRRITISIRHSEVDLFIYVNTAVNQKFIEYCESYCPYDLELTVEPEIYSETTASILSKFKRSPVFEHFGVYLLDVQVPDAVMGYYLDLEALMKLTT